MRSNSKSWLFRLARQMGWALAVSGAALFVSAPLDAFAQRDGGGKGGGGGRNSGGGGRGRASAPNVGGGARVAAPNAGGGARVNVPNAGGGARVAAPNVGGGARVAVPNAGGGAQIRANAPNVGGANAGARANVPNAVPNLSGGAQIRGNTGADVRLPTASGQARVRTPGVDAGARAGVPQITNPNAGTRVGANLGADVDAAARARTGAAGIGTNVDAATGARTTLRPNFDAAGNAGARANTNLSADQFRTRWATGRAGQSQNIQGGLSNALRANADIRANADVADSRGRIDADTRARVDADARAGANLRVDETTARRRAESETTADFNNRASTMGFRNAARANYWSNLGGSLANNFLYGNTFGPNVNGYYYRGNPYFGGNFWNGRNLIGLGVSAALGGGYGYGGYGGYGNWWGYSPWVGNRPWGYWYGNPGWNTFAGYYGWNTPYYYDYGPQGNVVYQGGQVYVNQQPVGTAEDYAYSAAELAMVTQEQMQADHDWVPLGTFSVATSSEDQNPVRVAQLAYDNKQGLISGTIFNRQSGNLYTLQGKVDRETQRVAFTIGNDPNAVFETGLYNLTQNATPVLLHQGTAQTQTWVFARLPEPKDEQAATTAAVPQRTEAQAVVPQQPAPAEAPAAPAAPAPQATTPPAAAPQAPTDDVPPPAPQN
jgi:hypothetical protein